MIPDRIANAPECPELASHVWKWYEDELFSPDVPLTFQEIHNWALLRSKKLMQWEITALKALDKEFRLCQ